jgi:lipoprotein-anchoring transpeptidase ErfK/SrfK
VPVQQSKPSKRRSQIGDSLAILLLLAVVGGAGWLWWHEKHPSRQEKRTEEKATGSNNARPAHEVIPSLEVVHRQSDVVTQLVTQTTNSGATTSSGAPAVSSNTVPIVPAKPVVTPEFPHPARNTLEAQIALARRAISPGALDGAIGSQTRAAIATFQRWHGLVPTLALDTNTESLLTLDAPLLTDYVVTSNDLAQLQPLGKTFLARSQQTALEYETILELVAEKGHAYRSLIEKLNPEIEWPNVPAGTSIKIPDVDYPEPEDKSAYVIIHLSDRYLEAFGTESNLLAHFPCSIAAKFDKRPLGELHVSVIAPNPNYTVNPAILTDSPEVQALGHKLVLPPGPRNPVGVAWIGLDRPGYGMHGTPNPEQIGRTESHGCFRLANWDAEYMVKLVWVGMPVHVVP